MNMIICYKRSTVATSEKVMQTCAKPVLITIEDRPTTDYDLVLTAKEEPVLITRIEPVLNTRKEPVLTKRADPALTNREDLVLTAREEPALITGTEPVMTTREKPVLTTNEPEFTTSSVVTVDHVIPMMFYNVEIISPCIVGYCGWIPS